MRKLLELFFEHSLENKLRQQLPRTMRLALIRLALMRLGFRKIDFFENCVN